MMPRITLAFLFFAAWCIASNRATAQDVPPFGQLPKLDERWKPHAPAAVRDSWGVLVMINEKTGDLLSFAARRLGPAEGHELIHFSDTAGELFPTGLPWWQKEIKAGDTKERIRNRVVKLDLPRSSEGKHRTQDVLEYTFVVEDADAPSRMAQGYAFLLGDLAVFVQHTSLRPITDFVAQDIAYQLIVTHERQEATAKTKPDTTTKPAR